MIQIRTCLFIFIWFSATTIDASPLRAFTNPLNNRQVDVFFVIDETKSSLTSMQYGLLKTALNNMASALNPIPSNPYIGVYFYGVTTDIDKAVPFTTNTSAAFKTKLDARPYPASQSNPSTLAMALSVVDSDCGVSCRAEVPRVLVIISARLDRSTNSMIRQLEVSRDLTVIVVSMGNINNNTGIGTLLATHPEEVYAIFVGNHYELIMTSDHIASVITDTPRVLQAGKSVYISIAADSFYHTVQVNTAPFTKNNEAIVMVATNCVNCPVYASLSQQIPTANNAIRNTDRHNFLAYQGYPNSLYYFRVPQDTSRIFVSFYGTGTFAVYFTCDVVTLPVKMQTENLNSGLQDLSVVIG